MVQAEPTTNGVANASLAAAARRATLKDIDYAATCDGGITVDAWLRSLAGRDARAIAIPLLRDAAEPDRRHAGCAQAGQKAGPMSAGANERTSPLCAIRSAPFSIGALYYGVVRHPIFGAVMNARLGVEPPRLIAVARMAAFGAFQPLMLTSLFGCRCPIPFSNGSISRPTAWGLL